MPASGGTGGSPGVGTDVAGVGTGTGPGSSPVLWPVTSAVATATAVLRDRLAWDQMDEVDVAKVA